MVIYLPYWNKESSSYSQKFFISKTQVLLLLSNKEKKKQIAFLLIEQILKIVLWL